MTKHQSTKDDYPLTPVKFSRLTRRGLILGLSLSQVIALAIAGLAFIGSLYAGGGMILAAGRCDAVAEPWPHARTAGKHRVTHGRRQPGRTAGKLGLANRVVQCPFDPAGDVHGRLLCLAQGMSI